MVDVLRRRRMSEALESNADALTRLEVMKIALSELSACVQTRELGKAYFPAQYSMLCTNILTQYTHTMNC